MAKLLLELSNGRQAEIDFNADDEMREAMDDFDGPVVVVHVEALADDD